MDNNKPPRGFIPSVHAMLNAIASHDLARLQATLNDLSVLRDKALDSPQEGWWNAGLTIGQMANEFMTAGRETAAEHEALDKSPRDCRILLAISTEPLNQTALAARLEENEGNLSKALDDLEGRGLVMRLREARSNKLFLTSAGKSILETHPNRCRLGNACPLTARPPAARRAVFVAGAVAPAATPPASLGEAIARRIAAVELKLREDHDRIEAAAQRLRELREIVDRAPAAHPPQVPGMARQEVELAKNEAAFLELKSRLAKGQDLPDREVVLVIEEQLAAVTREFE